MPAVSMVASWRLKIAISAEVTLPRGWNSWDCLRTRTGTTPWRRSSARTAASSTATVLPLMRLPLLSVPSQVKGDSLIAML